MGDLDPRMTFDSFVVGPANRLASAAARRAADSPAASYNPLFLYAPSGLGKSHILSAMAHHSARLDPEARVHYETLEGYIEELAKAIQDGTQDAMRDRYQQLDILLLDDVQFLTGQPEAQEMLLRTLDALNGSHGQIVLASDRPPAEIDGLDSRLLSRFSGGLMVDIGPPEYETRVAILRKRLEERQSSLGSDVVEAIARMPFRNVRELQGGFNRVVAVQELESRDISAADVSNIVEVPKEPLSRQVQASIAGVPAESTRVPEEPWQRLLRETAEAAEEEGFSAARLRRVLESPNEPANVDQIVGNYTGVLDQLRQIKSDLDMVGNPWPEAARGVLTDPERLDEAQALLASARERMRDFPPVPDGVVIESLSDSYSALSVRAAAQLVGDEPPEYNPLFVHSPDGWGARGLLEAAGTSLLRARPTARVALISAAEFAEEFITALSDGVAGAWRERWWTVELLLLHEAQGLSETERAQDEFFHLFEAIKRRGARIMLAADRPPSQIDNIDDRLRSRFEGGLVVDVAVEGEPPRPAEEILAEREARAQALATSFDSLDAGQDGVTQVRPDGADSSGDEVLDPAFQAQLQGLDGGTSGVHPPGAGMPAAAPAALTRLEINASEFPSLLPSEADRRLLENMGLQLRTESGVPLESESAESPSGPAENAPTGKSFDDSARAEFTDQIASVFSTGDPRPGATPGAPSGAVIPPDGSEGVSRSAARLPEAPTEAPTDAPTDAPTEAKAVVATAWIPAPENVIWEWPNLEDRIVTEDA